MFDRNSSSGIMPVALLEDGQFKLVKLVRVVEELALGGDCSGMKVGKLRFFSAGDAAGYPFVNAALEAIQPAPAFFPLGTLIRPASHPARPAA